MPAFATNGPQTRYLETRVGALALEVGPAAAAQLGLAGEYVVASTFARLVRVPLEPFAGAVSRPHPPRAASDATSPSAVAISFERTRE